ncbi:ParB/RepB/Spo0J family partition protein [Legionella oakridgensis]|uniref:Probable chromosome-partitioning protein ParB n=2 Tax=Legionella oakridgensis TaxID=29423 RepID=W0BIB0_9GAMM|nr:ParB/RepB/Spo0J family partition protein [Legionella oakridgensis]AHE68436.1 ParB-like partition protein [Legionella oakridgensis ATCC 33761 = DSM 21215]ETO92104.1 ParB-like partition protein [Legionella oakridgensis RV-2-2007]KTD38409.1 chromosome partitioning protein parB [Legionella oakridgensis]STY21374.1 chromosome partitioning protein parB [Legionella longbeachae]
MIGKRGSLGRNLSVLLSQTDNTTLSPEKPTSETIKLATDSLQPGKYQPRGEIEETALFELAESIRKQGLLQPLVVREISPGRYEIIAGERRWRACQLAGIMEVPAVLRQVDDETAMAMALVENLQREDLNAMDQARAMHRLTTEFALTHQQVAELLSKSRTAVSNYLRLLQLNHEVRQMLENGDLDMGHARCLLILEDNQQSQVARLVVAKNLSVRETEALVNRVKAAGSVSYDHRDRSIDMFSSFTEQLNTLAQQLQTRVSLKQGKSGKGTLVIHYDDKLALEKLISKLSDKN